MKRKRTEKQLSNLITRIEDDCQGDITELYEWLKNGNDLGYLKDRTDKSLIDEWNMYSN